MAQILVSRFRGIQPRQESASPGADTPASIAENCQLFEGVVKPFKANSLAESGHTGPDFVVAHSGPTNTPSWISGLVKPLQWKFGDFDMLFYLKDGAWKKRINNAEGSLGLKRPSPPNLESLEIPIPEAVNIDELAQNIHPQNFYLPYGQYSYSITFSKMIDGQEVEGPASDLMHASLYEDAKEVPATHPKAVQDPVSGKYYDTSLSPLRYHHIPRPPIPDSSIVSWNVYRSDNGNIPRLLFKAGATGAGENFDFVQDVTASVQNGRALGSLNNSTDEKYSLQYVITFERNVGGMLDESGPSTPVNLTVQNIGVKISRPISIPTGVSHWNIYRLSQDFDPTTEFQRVARVPIAQTNFEDYLPNRSLGVAIPTSLLNSDGIQIDFDKPPVVFAGLGGPHYSMLFGWKGSTLYYSRPGKPDAWPVFYSVEAMAEIINVISNGADLLVLTTKGLQRGVGTSPDDFYLAQTVNGEGAISAKASLSCEAGVFYLSHAGIVQVNGSQSRVFTDVSLNRDFFDSFDKSSVFMEYQEGSLFLFHSEGVLRFDTRDGKYTTLNDSYDASFVDKIHGKLYVMQGGVIKTLGASTDKLTLTYQTGDIVLSEPQLKRFRKFELFGSGRFYVSIFIDDQLIKERELDLDGMRRDRLIFTGRSDRGRSAKVKIVGSGELKEIRIEVMAIPLYDRRG